MAENASRWAAMRDILLCARDLISTRSKWTKGAFARSGDRTVTTPGSTDAVRWCLVGAIDKCYDGKDTESYKAARERLDNTCILRKGRGAVQFNDHATTTHADVLAVLDAAVRSVSEDQQREEGTI